jgi:hypothetical protein
MTATRARSRNGPVHAGLVASLALLALVVSACNAASSASPAATQATNLSTGASAASGAASAGAATQTSEAGQVTVAVTWDRRESAPVFRVALDTHSVNLDAVDLSQAAVLRTDKGVEVRPSGWDAPKGGHHRSGSLTFPSITPAGTPVLGEDTRSLELVIRDVAGVPERRFDWTL